MTNITKTLVSIAFLFAASVSMACDYPTPPKELPDGKTATKEEMLAGVKKISEYQEAMTTYLACIEADQVVALQALAEEDEEGRKASNDNFNKRYNAAVDEQTRTVEMFNLEIRAYKAQ